jgi:hypothetical protein
VGKDIGRDLIHKVQEGLESRGNLSTASRDPRSGKTVAKHDLCQWHVVISEPYTKGSVKNGKNEVF